MINARIKFEDIEELPMSLTLTATAGEFKKLRNLISNVPPDIGNAAPLTGFLRQLDDLLARAGGDIVREQWTTGWSKGMVEGEGDAESDG